MYAMFWQSHILFHNKAVRGELYLFARMLKTVINLTLVLIKIRAQARSKSKKQKLLKSSDHHSYYSYCYCNFHSHFFLDISVQGERCMRLSL